MQIGIQSSGFKLTDGLRSYCDRKLRCALGASSGKVRSVLVRLADENGPRGGVDKRCTIRALLHGNPMVIIVQDEADMYVAIDRAVDRVSRTVTRRAEKSWSSRRLLTPGFVDDGGADLRPD